LQALSITARRGLIDSCQGKGNTVRELLGTAAGTSLAELIRAEKVPQRHFVEVYRSMAGWTAYHAAQRALPEKLQELEMILEQMEHDLHELKATREPYLPFHDAVAKATNNIIWQHLMRSILIVMKEHQWGLWQAGHTDRSSRLASYHRKKEVYPGHPVTGARSGLAI
jgi:DNA-binding FadR family transcriptional regulator